ncbi:MAG: hypothetical protein KGD59_05895 [Candidatus Heimdallarchaeota archaeon]|nr:hypothetical protein [Candidatus Heimdallarchaeota archaeon]MBY8994064.1 hypothetical protein [Candidatus Heimdallarchaeota archaeon]
MKLKIVPVSNHWLIYQVDGNKTPIGRIRITPNSIIFLLNDSKARLETRVMDDRVFYKISSNGTVLKSFSFTTKNSRILKWKTIEESPKILKCYSKYSRAFLKYKDTKIAHTLPIAGNTHILNLQSSPDFSPIVLLASFFPFFN